MISKISNLFFKALSLTNNLFEYLLNDPTTPQLSEIMPFPKKSSLEFNVHGMPFDKNPKNSSQTRSLNCYFIIGNCLNNIEKYSPKKICSWSITKNLNIYPAAGQDLNAYYDRRSLKFFYYPYSGKNVYFADSSDILTHELGHAFLDAIRPDFWNVQSLEIWSFHEAFSDIVAMFNMMSYEKAIKFVLEETNGNLEKSNVISKLAEEVGKMIRNISRDPAYLENSLRDPAVEHFNYTNPNFLPKEAPNNALASECHSFGRVFSGIWYRIFIKLYKSYSVENNPLDAFKEARNDAFSILMQAIPISPRVSEYYYAIAKSMCLVAKSRNEVVYDIVKSTFKEFNIDIDENKLVELKSCADLKQKIVSSLSKKDEVLKTSNSVGICIKNKKMMKLKDLPIVSSLSIDSSIEIEVPYDYYYEFNELGELTTQITPNDELIAESVSNCVLSISSEIGKNKMWNIDSGILKRNFIK